MKSIFVFSTAMLLVTGFFSCKQNNVSPQKKTNTTHSLLDTSTTLIDNSVLVGTWNIVSDTISFRSDTMYHGKAGDHYTFSKYGNLYAKSAFYQFTDTSIYTVSHDTVRLTVLYVAEGGSIIKGPVGTDGYVISSLTATSLVLTQNAPTPDGLRYEQIVFSKAQ